MKRIHAAPSHQGPGGPRGGSSAPPHRKYALILRKTRERARRIPLRSSHGHPSVGGPRGRLRTHFLSNVDPAHTSDILDRFDPSKRPYSVPPFLQTGIDMFRHPFEMVVAQFEDVDLFITSNKMRLFTCSEAQSSDRTLTSQETITPRSRHCRSKCNVALLGPEKGNRTGETNSRGPWPRRRPSPT